jgi:hypothetical protein
MRLVLLVAAALAAALAGPGTALAAPEVVPEPASYSFTDTPATIPPPAEVEFRNVGDLDAQLGFATLTGANASAFYVSDDGCSGTTLASPAPPAHRPARGSTFRPLRRFSSSGNCS